MKKYIIIYCFGCFSFCNVKAQIDIQATLSKNRIFVGDKTELTLQVIYSNGWEFETLNPDTIKSVGIEFSIPKNEGYWETHKNVPNGTMYRTKISLQCFNPDTLDIPPIPIYYTHEGVMDTAYTLPLLLTVFPVEPDSTNSLTAILPIMEEPKNIEDYQNQIILVIFMLLTLGCGYYFYRKNIHRIQKAKYVIELSASEKAMIELKNLENKNLWQNGENNRFCTELSHILRDFLESQYKIQALENTTSEILSQLRNCEAIEQYFHVWSEILLATDAVKFSNAKPERIFFEQAIPKATTLIYG